MRCDESLTLDIYMKLTTIFLRHTYIMLTLVWYSKYVWSSLSLPNHSFSYSSSMPFHRNSSHHPCKAPLNDLLIRFIIKGQFSPEWSSKQDKTQKTHWLMAADLTVSPPPTWATVISSLMNLMLMKSSGSSESSTARQSEADRLHDAGEVCGIHNSVGID